MLSVRYCYPTDEGCRWSVVHLSPACFTEPASAARAEAAHLLGLDPADVELVFRGQPLADSEPIVSYGVGPGSIIHAFLRPPPPAAISHPASSKWDQAQLATLKAAVMNPAYRTLLERLGRPEVLDQLLTSVPGLADDPVAIGILQEPTLLRHLTDPAVASKLAARHPSLAAASSQLAAVLQESLERGAAGPSRASAPAQAMHAQLDEEDGEEAAAAPPPITRAQLAAALAAAGADPAPPAATAASVEGAAADPAAGPATGPADPAAEPTAATSTATSSATSAAAFAGASAAVAPMQPTSDIISSEMVSVALREALSSLPGTAPAPAPGPAPAPAPAAAAAPEVTSQPQVSESAVRQLLELGITDDEALVRHALHVTGGNIDQAFEFIYASM